MTGQVGARDKTPTLVGRQFCCADCRTYEPRTRCAAPSRNQNIELFCRIRWTWRRHQAGIDDLVPDCVCKRKGVFNPRKGGVPMNHHKVKTTIHEVGGLVIAPWLHPFLKDVAN